MEQGLQVKSLGIPWFRKEDYDEFRKLFVDRDNLFDTFEEWEAAATERERELKANDVPVVRIALDPKTFVA